MPCKMNDIVFKLHQAEPMLIAACKAAIERGLIKNSDMVDLLLNMTIDSFGDIQATNHNGICATVSLITSIVVFDINQVRHRVKLRYEVVSVY